ncbi:hypothetical protein N9C10_03515 [Flavobacteriaceae bacterium]|nr:hypothetical protein [Flavobacteriaceae bacterium]
MAFQPKLVVLTLVGILMLYNLIIISKNSYDKCKDETEKLFKDKKFWIPLTVGVGLLLLSFMMTSKYGKAKAKAALAKARASGAARATI